MREALARVIVGFNPTIHATRPALHPAVAVMLIRQGADRPVKPGDDGVGLSAARSCHAAELPPAKAVMPIRRGVDRPVELRRARRKRLPAGFPGFAALTGKRPSL
jgi:hypothetical protein